MWQVKEHGTLVKVYCGEKKGSRLYRKCEQNYRTSMLTLHTVKQWHKHTTWGARGKINCGNKYTERKQPTSTCWTLTPSHTKKQSGPQLSSLLLPRRAAAPTLTIACLPCVLLSCRVLRTTKPAAGDAPRHAIATFSFFAAFNIWILLSRAC